MITAQAVVKLGVVWQRTRGEPSRGVPGIHAAVCTNNGTGAGLSGVKTVPEVEGEQTDRARVRDIVGGRSHRGFRRASDDG